MIQIRTVTGELFQVAWVGISSIDGSLRFSLIQPEPMHVLQVFTNSENCTTIYRVIDGEEDLSFEGYTVFRGIQISYDNNVLVTLSKI